MPEIMARATRSSTAQQQHPRKRKRTSSVGPAASSKIQKTDDDDDNSDPGQAFLSSSDARKILDVLELSDTQGLLDRVFPSRNAPSLLLSLRTLLERPAEHPLTAIRAAINHLFPISSLPRSRPSPAASQQLAFSNLALSLIEQASFNAIPASLEKVDILEPSKPEGSPTLAKRKYALVQHLPSGDYWSSLSSETPSSHLKNLPTGRAELVAIIPSASSVSADSVPTLGSISSRPLAQTKHIHGQRRVPTGAFLDYGPYASFAPSFESTGEIVGQRQLSEVIYQKEQKKRTRRDQTQPIGYVQEIAEEDVVMNVEPISDEDLNSLLSPEDAIALKQALGSLELETAVQHLLERNCQALKRLEELQSRRLSKGGPNVKPPEEGSEEWETAQCIMDSIATLASLRPRSSAEDGPPLVPSPAVLRKLHRSLALEPSPGWHGNLPATRTTALHDDSTIKVKSPTPAPAAAVATPVANPAPATPAPTGYPGYPYNYSTAQQQGYRPTAATYAQYKPAQGAYYQSYAAGTTQQSYYNAHAFSGTSNQQPYGSTPAAGQTYPYGTWYNQYQPAASAGAKPATPVAAAPTSYNTFFTAAGTAATNGVAAAVRSPAVANTVANKAVTPQAAGAWPANAYQTMGVAPTLPSHLRTAQSSTPTPLSATAYQQQAGYYQAAAYQTQPSATPSR